MCHIITLSPLDPSSKDNGIARTFISTEVLGEAFEPEQKFENPDGSPIVFKLDYFDEERGVNPLPGPFASGEEAKESLF